MIIFCFGNVVGNGDFFVTSKGIIEGLFGHCVRNLLLIDYGFKLLLFVAVASFFFCLKICFEFLCFCIVVFWLKELKRNYFVVAEKAGPLYLQDRLCPGCKEQMGGDG